MEQAPRRATCNGHNATVRFLKLVVRATTVGYCCGGSIASEAPSLGFVTYSRPNLGRTGCHPRFRSPSSAYSTKPHRGARSAGVTPTASLGRRSLRWATNALRHRDRSPGSAASTAGARLSSSSRVSAATAGSAATAATAAVVRASARGAGFGHPGVDGDGSGAAAGLTYSAGTAGTGRVSMVRADRVGWRRGEDWRSTAAAAARSATLESFRASTAELDQTRGVGGVEQEQDELAATEERRPRPKLRFMVDLRNDVTRRAALYKSDWVDGFNRKSLPAILFLYFACLLPAVAFGGIASQVTQGTLGVIEYLVSCGIGGMAYATLSGQPMTFIGPTGLTLAFMTALYSFTSVAGLPFLPVYSWVGLWTSGMLMSLALAGASNLIEYATQFTDDVFNALLSVNFIFEACRSLQRNFNPAVAGYSQAGALMSMNVALATYVGCRGTSGARESRYLTSGFREFLSDFGPLLVIISMSIFCATPFPKGLLSFLEVPSAFMLGQGRSWFVPLMSVSPMIRLASALPALLLTSLFFLDQNISSRVVNSPRHKMVKGPAYHQDMLVLGFITGALSIVGLPWQCAATVQSLNHVRQMATLESSSKPGGGKSEEIVSLHETRLTGFCVHALVLGSLALLPQLAKIPMAVVSGIFLYLGRKVMSGNAFLIRAKEFAADQSMLSPDSDIKRVGFRTAFGYTAVQAAMLGLLWTLKSFKQTALFFPSVIGLLIIVRLAVLPKVFSKRDLSKLDAAVG